VTDQITDEEAVNSCHWMRDNAPALAKAKAHHGYLCEYRKTIKATLIRACNDTGAQAKESYAYAHPDYLVNLQGIKVAAEEMELLRWRMRAAEIKYEIWRTQCSNRRRGA